MVLSQYIQHPEYKSLAPDGQPCNADTRGLLKRYPVTASEFHLIGKETERSWEQADDISTLLPSLVRYREKVTIASAEAALDVKITEILRVVDEIQSHSKPVIDHCYRAFLLQNNDPEEREYPDPEDQIREVLIHGNYLSQRDIDVCVDFDLDALAREPEYPRMRELHESLVERWATSDT